MIQKAPLRRYKVKYKYQYTEFNKDTEKYDWIRKKGQKYVCAYDTKEARELINDLIWEKVPVLSPTIQTLIIPVGWPTDT